MITKSTKRILDYLSNDDFTYKITKLIINHSIISVIVLILLGVLSGVWVKPLFGDLLLANCGDGSTTNFFWLVWIIVIVIVSLIICNKYWSDDWDEFKNIRELKRYINDKRD